MLPEGRTRSSRRQADVKAEVRAFADLEVHDVRRGVPLACKRRGPQQPERYPFTADRDGVFALDYDIPIGGSNTFGLNPFNFLWLLPGAPVPTQVSMAQGTNGTVTMPVVAGDREAWPSAIALASDNFIGYNTWKWIELHSATGESPVYRYLFDQHIPTAEGPPASDDPGTPHAMDIEFVFPALDSRALAWSDRDRRGGRDDELLDELREDGRPERRGAADVAGMARRSPVDAHQSRRRGRAGSAPGPLLLPRPDRH